MQSKPRIQLRFKALIIAALVAGGMVGISTPALAQQSKFITVGTGGIVGVYYPLGGAICRFVNANRKDHGLRCTVESTGGSVFNINAVMSGDMDIGFAQSDTQYYAMTGVNAFKDKPQPKLRALFSVYPELLTLVARQDANIKTFADIKGKRINIGDPGSGTRGTTELHIETKIKDNPFLKGRTVLTDPRVIKPGPNERAHSTCSQAPVQAALKGSNPRASSPVMKPARTSPEPAVASHGAARSLRAEFMAQLPSGEAMTVSGPLKRTAQPARAAASRVASFLE